MKDAYPDTYNGGKPDGMLQERDLIGATFYIACNMMLAFTAFFFMMASSVPRQWRPSVIIAGIVTGVAFYNYTFMKNQWVETKESPTVYRYCDWLITVPLQIVEFYFILKAQGSVSSALGFRLFLASILMVGFGWLGELDLMPKIVSFFCGCFMWIYIIYEVFGGEAKRLSEMMVSQASKEAYQTLRLIVSFGWCIYPIGFFVSYLAMRPGSQEAEETLNIIYNLADLINKGAFGLCIYSAAENDYRSNGRTDTTIRNNRSDGFGF